MNVEIEYTDDKNLIDEFKTYIDLYELKIFTEPKDSFNQRNNKYNVNIMDENGGSISDDTINNIISWINCQKSVVNFSVNRLEELTFRNIKYECDDDENEQKAIEKCRKERKRYEKYGECEKEEANNKENKKGKKKKGNKKGNKIDSLLNKMSDFMNIF